MKRLLLLSLFAGSVLGANARSGHSHMAPGRHGHRHHRAYLTTREEQKPIHREKR